MEAFGVHLLRYPCDAALIESSRCQGLGCKTNFVQLGFAIYWRVEVDSRMDSSSISTADLAILIFAMVDPLAGTRMKDETRARAEKLHHDSPWISI